MGELRPYWVQLMSTEIIWSTARGVPKSRKGPSIGLRPEKAEVTLGNRHPQLHLET